MSNIATTISQSRKLVELGLDPNSADMYYPYLGAGQYGDILRVGFPIEYSGGRDIPAWSFPRLLDMMPGGLSENWMVQSLTDGRFMASYSCPVCYKTFTANTLFEAVFNMVVWYLGGSDTDKKGGEYETE